MPFFRDEFSLRAVSIVRSSRFLPLLPLPWLLCLFGARFASLPFIIPFPSQAIVSRKWVVPEIYDTVKELVELCIRGHSREIRDIAGSIIVTFLLDYPLGMSSEASVSVNLLKLMQAHDDCSNI